MLRNFSGVSELLLHKPRGKVDVGSRWLENEETFDIRKAVHKSATAF